MIHVLLCPHTLDYGGAQLSTLHWARLLDKNKFKVTILATKPGGLSDKYEKYFSVYYDDIDYPNIIKYIKKLRPNLLHACPGGGIEQKYISEASKLIPVTQTIMCPRLVANREEVKYSVFLSSYPLTLQKDLTHVGYIDAPFDASDYEIKYSKDHFALPEDKIIIGSVGNLRRENSHFMKIARKYKN